MEEKLGEHITSLVPALLKSGEIKVAKSWNAMPRISIDSDGVEFHNAVKLEFALKAETIISLTTWTERRVKEYING